MRCRHQCRGCKYVSILNRGGGGGEGEREREQKTLVWGVQHRRRVAVLDCFSELDFNPSTSPLENMCRHTLVVPAGTSERLR